VKASTSAKTLALDSLSPSASSLRWYSLSTVSILSTGESSDDDVIHRRRLVAFDVPWVWRHPFWLWCRTVQSFHLSSKRSRSNNRVERSAIDWYRPMSKRIRQVAPLFRPWGYLCRRWRLLYRVYVTSDDWWTAQPNYRKHFRFQFISFDCFVWQYCTATMLFERVLSYSVCRRVTACIYLLYCTSRTRRTKRKYNNYTKISTQKLQMEKFST